MDVDTAIKIVVRYDRKGKIKDILESQVSPEAKANQLPSAVVQLADGTQTTVCNVADRNFQAALDVLLADIKNTSRRATYSFDAVAHRKLLDFIVYMGYSANSAALQRIILHALDAVFETEISKEQYLQYTYNEVSRSVKINK